MAQAVTYVQVAEDKIVPATKANPLPANHATRTIGHGVKTVTSAGTDEPLVASSTPARWVEVQAQTDNTDGVAVGGSGVDATVATGTGILLFAGESRMFPINDLTDIYVDALVSGEGVRYIYGA